tara:strand:- start:260 stop:820 length:561 start_codon:yes stop_codon:yes gene_type:complete
MSKKAAKGQKKEADQSAVFYMKGEMRESEDVPIAQRPDVRIPVGDPVPSHTFRDQCEVVAHVDAKKLNEMAFQDEPVTIRIHPTGGKHKDPWMFCQVNGNAVMLVNGAWKKVQRFPRSTTFTTKRYCVETIARAKIDEIEAGYDLPPNADPHNTISCTTTAAASFVVMKDESPRAQEWLEDLLQSR